jgi:hypothetical protein
MITWITPAGSLGLLTERVIVDIPLEASSDTGTITYSLIAGSLPRGLRLTNEYTYDSSQTNGFIKGSPTEVKVYTESKFVIRASDGVDIEDRTFTIAVDGSDVPAWITQEGFLNVGPAEAFFVLDNAQVNFQLEARDSDLSAGGKLEFYLLPNGGLLPPGLSLSIDGVISGFTDPIFALEYLRDPFGGYDTTPLDVTPLDFVEVRSNGFDTFFYDNQTYDYNEPSRTPRRLSRIYTFIVAVTDGVYTETRLFKIYVVTEEFLQADNSIVQVDTNLFTSDASSARLPIWITESNLGRFRANNYVTIFLDVYDPPTLTGTITYFLLPTNPDGSASEIPPGMTLDNITGEIAGSVPYQSRVSRTYTFTMRAVNFPSSLAYTLYSFRGSWNTTINYFKNDAVIFDGLIYICTVDHRNRLPTDTEFWTVGTSSASKTFTVEIIGEIESAITWITDSDLGTIKPNQASQKYLEAESLLYGGRVSYEFVSGKLPPGLEFLPTGLVQGKVKQFADDAGPGLTRFFERTDSLAPEEDSSTPSRNFTDNFDGNSTSFDKKFTFTVKARDSINFASVNQTFFLTVVADNTKTFANLYIKAFQTKTKRLDWYDFITDATIFRSSDLYRYGDPNFGIQTGLKILVFAGIESTDAVKYVQAMSRNHYRKRIYFGDVKVAQAKDPLTQEVIYEVIYVDVMDEYEKKSKSISQTVELSNNINSKVLISYDSIRVDSDIPFVSDSDHQRVFPNSLKNMRKRITTVGDRDREFLPLWMRSIQPNNFVESGYVSALPLCYCNPNSSPAVLARIKASAFDFKTIDFHADRYVIDILDNTIEDKYLAFPQRNIINNLAAPSPIIDSAPVLINSFDSNSIFFDNSFITFDQG